MKIKARTYFEKDISVDLSDNDLVLRYNSDDMDDYWIGIYPNMFCQGKQTKYYMIQTETEVFRDELYNVMCYDQQRILKADLSQNESVCMHEYDINSGFNPVLLRGLEIILSTEEQQCKIM